MISRESFIEKLEIIQNFSDWEDDLYVNFGIDLINTTAPMCCDACVEILDEVFKTDLVSYWCWECGFGRSMDCTLYNADGEIIITIGDVGDLYDYLIKELNDEK